VESIRMDGSVCALLHRLLYRALLECGETVSQAPITLPARSLKPCQAVPCSLLPDPCRSYLFHPRPQLFEAVAGLGGDG